MKGFLLALQFFTIIPIHKELPMTKRTITTMFSALPIVGAFIGLIAALIYSLLVEFTNFSPLLLAFFLVMTYVVLTGGLHLDGLIDTGDAYFSYRSIEKRHEILDDPRVGAFGVMTVLFTVLAKVFFMNELIVSGSLSFYWLLFIPFLSRIAMSLYLVQTPASKETGMGAFFKAHLHLKLFITITLTLLLGGAALVSWWSHDFMTPLYLIVVTVIMASIYRWWTIKNFNGSSGDLYGAFVEGMECILWLTLLFLL